MSWRTLTKKKNEYQDAVEDFIDEYNGRIDYATILDRWREDIIEIGKQVKQHA